MIDSTNKERDIALCEANHQFVSVIRNNGDSVLSSRVLSYYGVFDKHSFGSMRGGAVSVSAEQVGRRIQNVVLQAGTRILLIADGYVDVFYGMISRVCSTRETIEIKMLYVRHERVYTGIDARKSLVVANVCGWIN